MKTQLFTLFGWPSESNFLLSDDVAELENLLQSQLTPITARPAFVRDLRKRLSKEIDPTLLQKRLHAQRLSSFWQRIFLTAAGILSGTVLILLGVRAIVSLIATLALREQERRTV